MLIETTTLGKTFRSDTIETAALSGVSLRIDKGEFVSIMGPSGCGKSTLMNILGLIDAPSSGQYHFLGQETRALPERSKAALRKTHIGFVFQSFNLIEELSVYENVELPLLYNRVKDKERKEKVERALQRMDIKHRARHYPRQLSGGQQQRVAVARATVHEPPLILADEPTGNLDSEHGQEVMNLLLQLNQEGTTIVMVTHSLSQAEVGKRIVRMLDGHIYHEEAPQRLYA